MKTINKIVYMPNYRTFVIDFGGTGENVAIDLSTLSEAEQLVFLNLWDACRLQIDIIGYLVYDKSSDALNIDPLDVSIMSVLLDESKRNELDEVLNICENLV
jgi:hypothetical protein